MFYNLQRSTRAAREEAEKAKLTGVGHSVINPKERLLNFQKRQKLKDLLITKFMQKYGLNQPDQVLEKEITQFLQGEKLNDVDLQRLDAKIKRIFQNRKANQQLKSTLTQSLLDRNSNLNKSQPDLLPRIQDQNNNNLSSTINQNLDYTE
jgi:polynucleotide 5'-kinase involved in rRNA processing